jgi:hypothetical protein
MSSIDLKADLSGSIKWSATLASQMPFATSRALNRTAFEIRQQLNYETTKYFDRPNRFTQTAFRVERSTKTNLSALIYAEDKRARYLRFGIDGGDRPQKGFEKAFLSNVIATRTVPDNAQLVPTRLVRRNAQGNVSLGTIRRISQGLNGSARGGFFYGKPEGGGKNANKPVGIYRRSREQLFPYFYAKTQRRTYKPKFPMAAISFRIANDRWMDYLMSSLQQAVATAR